MTITVNPAKAIIDLTALCKIGLPALILGQPGVGKSDIGRDVARAHLGTDDLVETGAGRNFIDFRASLIDPVDLHGLPTIDKEKMVARWLPMGLLPSADDQSEGVLFIDEVTNADKSVQGALYGLILPPHRVGEYTLPPGWKIIAAGNRVEDRAAAGRMASALSNRFIQMTLEPIVEDWVEWSIVHKVAVELIAFMRFRPELLNDFDGARPINATPRSWAMVAKILDQHLPEDVEQRLILGAVGEGPGTEFLAFLKIWRELPNPDVVLMNPDSAVVPETSAGQYAISAALAKRVRENSMEGFTAYLKRMPAEFGVMAMRDATKRDPMLATTREHIEWAQKNQDVYL